MNAGKTFVSQSVISNNRHNCDLSTITTQSIEARSEETSSFNAAQWRNLEKPHSDP